MMALFHLGARAGIMKIAYQGEPGAFSEAAGRRIAPDAELVPCKSFEDVFAAVQAGHAPYGILPIENSVGGSIHRNYDLLMAHEVPIQGEIELPVVHQLLALQGTTIERLRRVYSHPQALAQCERFLRTLKGVEIIATYDTAGSAKMVAEERLENAAAIASARGRALPARAARRLHSGLRRQHHALHCDRQAPAPQGRR